MFSNVTGTLAADVLNNGTFTISYPASQRVGAVTNAGTFQNGVRHRLLLGQAFLDSPVKFSLSFGASNITVTNKSGGTWAAGTAFTFQLEWPGEVQLFDAFTSQALIDTVSGFLVHVTLGSPAALSASAVLSSTPVPTIATNVLAATVVLDVPRAVQILTSNAGNTTNVITVTGVDVYNQAMTEAITCNGATAVLGKKAFSKVTSIVSSVVLIGNLVVGTTDILGLPVMLPSGGLILKELIGGVQATAGTTVVAAQTSGGSTSTTGDPRGTYVPNSATNGANAYQLILCLPDPGYIGMPQA